MCLTLFCVLNVDVPFACEQMPGNKAHCCAKGCPAPSRPAKHKEKTYSAHLLPYSVTNFDTKKLSRDDWQTAVACTKRSSSAKSDSRRTPQKAFTAKELRQHLFDVIRAAAAPLPPPLCLWQRCLSSLHPAHRRSRHCHHLLLHRLQALQAAAHPQQPLRLTPPLHQRSVLSRDMCRVCWDEY